VLDRLDIVADFRSLLFHPWSTLETVQADIGFLHSVVPHMATCFSFHEVEIYPGTPLADRLRAEGRGKGDPWPLSYTLTDPRAELLRRLGRFVFGSGPHTGIQGLLTQAWYDLLLQRRFEPAQLEPAKARKLKAIAASVNAQSLHVWQEMLGFASESDIYDAVENVRRSESGEYYLTDAVMDLVRAGKPVGFDVLSCMRVNINSPAELERAWNYVLAHPTAANPPDA